MHPKQTNWFPVTGNYIHDDVIKWKPFPRYWFFVRGIHLLPLNSPSKGQWRGALMFSMICAWINGWVNNHQAGDLRRHRAHYDVISTITHSVSTITPKDIGEYTRRIPRMSFRPQLQKGTTKSWEYHIDGLVQEKRNSSALAMELRLLCTNPSIWSMCKCVEQYTF